MSSQSDGQPDVVIDAEEFEAARRDPRVRALHTDAEAYAAELIARGHCRCHLTVDCPDAGKEARNRG